MSPLADVITRAATLEERRARGAHPPVTTPARRLDAWQSIVARGDAERWRRRLRHDGIDPSTAASLVESSGDATDRERGARWWELLQSAIAIAAQSTDWHASTDRALRAEAPYPFEHVLLPFIVTARAAIRTPHLAAFTAAAQAQLERALLRRLTSIAAPILYEEFTAAGGGIELDDAMPERTAPREIYDRFVCAQCAGAMADVFARYAALARLLATRCVMWAEATAELCDQLAADRRVIEHTFTDDRPLGDVVNAQSELSDSHNGGRMVSILTFSNGLTLVHKPRSLAPERAFQAFVEWANAAGVTPALPALRAIDCGDRGWMEYGEAAPCTTRAGAALYYRRAGMLACSMYLIGGKDLHSGNVLARGAEPLLIDLEMLVQPTVPDERIADAAAVGTWRHVHGSVLSSYLIPMLCRDAHGGTFTEGGFARGDAGREGAARRWYDVNTDAMALYEEPAFRPAGSNVPQDVDGFTRDDEFVALVRGFRDFYTFLMSRRAELMAPDGPLTAFGPLRVRLLLRSTDVYDGLLRRALRPEAMVTGADRSIDFDALRRPFLRGPERHRLWDAVACEVAALERGDVPIFHMQADGTALLSGERTVVADYAMSPGFAQMAARVRRLGAADLERQTHFLRVAWSSYRARWDAARLEASAHAAPPSSDARMLGEDRAMSAAVAIAASLRRTAVKSPRGGAEWMTLGDRGLTRTDLSFANGRAGVALFYSALSKLGFNNYYADALAPIEPLLAADETRVRQLVHSHGIGGARGVGGIIYALTRIGQWLGEPAALRAAERFAGALTQERIGADRKLDVFAGSAGAMLGLLALHEATGSGTSLAAAVWCGRHLLSRRSIDRGKHRAWRTLNRELTGGFGHGAAGIAYALDRLRNAVHDETMRDAIQEAIDDTIDFEGSLYVPEAGNWASNSRRVRALGEGADSAPLICGWCHGAAGIGLGRLALRDHAKLSGDDIERALAAMRANESAPPPQDHLCCGNAGRIELLLYAGMRLGRADLTERSLRYAASVVERAHARTSWGAGSVDDGFAPTMFFGTSGIGYELLRLHHTAELPSVLLWG